MKKIILTLIILSGLSIFIGCNSCNPVVKQDCEDEQCSPIEKNKLFKRFNKEKNLE